MSHHVTGSAESPLMRREYDIWKSYSDFARGEAAPGSMEPWGRIRACWRPNPGGLLAACWRLVGDRRCFAAAQVWVHLFRGESCSSATSRAVRLFCHRRGHAWQYGALGGKQSPHQPRAFGSRGCLFWTALRPSHTCPAMLKSACQVERELTGFFPRIDRIFPTATSKRYLKG